MEKKRACWGLLRRRSGLRPTWRGWLLLFFSSALLLVLAARGAHRFLSLNQPRPGGVLVLEGWAPAYVLEGGVAEFNRTHYDRVFVTGGPIEWGAALSSYKTYADLGAATLLKLGLNSNLVQAVPSAAVRQDRTYASAVALKQWWRAHGMSPAQINLWTVGARARRSRLLYQRALGKGVAVGVVAFPLNDYDARHWWRSSQGFRVVTSELTAYAYARVLFWKFKSG